MRQLDRVDWLLFLTTGIAVVMLVMTLAWPAIEPWWYRPRPGKQVTQQFIGSVVTEEYDRKILVNYLIYLPDEYQNDKTWPLVVFLHGAGEKGNDLEKVRRTSLPTLAEQGRDFPFVLVSPQCPKDSIWEPERVLALIEHICSDWPIDQQRVYLIGYSMGGYGTWQTAAVEPDRFAAIVPIAGGGNSEEAEKLVDLPIWVFHGNADKCVPLKASQEMVEAVRAAGGNPKLTIFEQAGHGIATKTFTKEELWDWLLAQRREAPTGDRPIECEKPLSAIAE